jgi:hypothetical protein
LGGIQYTVYSNTRCNVNPTDKDNNMPDYKPMAVVKNETIKKLHDSLIKSLSQHFKENLTNLPIILTGDRDT